MAVIDIDLVERWLQPTPDITAGESTIGFTGDAAAVAMVGVFADAPFASSAVTVVVVLGAAEFGVNTDGAAAPAVLGAGSIGFDGEVEIIAAALTRGSADVILDGNAATIIVGDAVAAFGVLTSAAVLMPTEGPAEVGFADYGGGSAPILPFKLPVSFTDNLLNIQDAAARVVVSGAGLDVAAAVVGSAVPLFDGGFGSTLPVDFPFTFGANVWLAGSTPIFPYLYAALFDEPANDQAGVALADVESDGVVEVPVDGAAEAGIAAGVTVYRRAIFPLLLPVSFTAGDQFGEAVVQIVQSKSSFPLLLPFTFGTNVEVPTVGGALMDFHVPGLVG